MDILGVIVVKAIIPSSKTGCSNLVLLDGTVASCQGDGSISSRPSGTDGDYEQWQVNTNLAVAYPRTNIKSPQPFVYAVVYGDKVIA